MRIASTVVSVVLSPVTVANVIGTDSGSISETEPIMLVRSSNHHFLSQKPIHLTSLAVPQATSFIGTATLYYSQRCNRAIR